MGHVKARIKVQNYLDWVAFKEGGIPEDAIRSVEVETIVDTGATFLCLPAYFIEELGLHAGDRQRGQTANGFVARTLYGVAQITLFGRSVQMSVMETDDETPPLIGVLVLEALDLVVDPRRERLIPNPDYGGQWTVHAF